MVRSRQRIALLMLVIVIAGSVAASSDGPQAATQQGCMEPARPGEPEPTALAETAAIALVWSGPPTLLANQPVTYTLTAHNVSKQAASNVVVQVRVPDTTIVSSTKPKAERKERVYLWNVGTLEASKTQAFQLTLKAANCCELGCEAWVSYTGSSAMTVAVRDPKLKIEIQAPKTLIVGEGYPMGYTITNNGNCRLINVKTEYRGESRNVGIMEPDANHYFPLDAITDKGGLHTYTIKATGSDGVTADAKATVKVLVPKLSIVATGPKQRYVGTKADYTATVTNSGEVPLTDVVVSLKTPTGLTGSALNTSIPTLAIGESKTLAWHGLVEQAGSLRPTFEAKGPYQTKASDDALTIVEGIPAIRVELIDLDDPIRVGDETTYEIRVTNTGSASDSQLTLACQLPAQMKFVSAKGPVKFTHTDKNRVVFDSIATLAPQTEARFLVTVKTTAAGDTRFQAVIKSSHLSTPVTNEESTRIYGE